MTSKNIFITLQYSGDILGIYLKQTLAQCSSNILQILPCDYWNLPKDQHLLLSDHTLLIDYLPAQDLASINLRKTPAIYPLEGITERYHNRFFPLYFTMEHFG